MGQVESTARGEDDHFVIVSNKFPKELQINREQSRLVSFGIDRQTSPKFQHKTLSSVTVKDAKLVRDSFVEVGAVCRSNAFSYAASRQTEKCTAKGIKEVLQKYASEVGENGLFLFHFSGHGVTVRNKEWGLAPADFDYSRDTYLTAEVLGSWLSEIKCVAKYIIFTLDCCYAGGIAKELTDNTISRSHNLYVMSACMAHETSLVLGPLRNSVFTYFLSKSVRSHIGCEAFPIRAIFNECRTCCGNLTATLVMYNKETGLQIKTMTPGMAVRNINSRDEVDTRVGRFEYVIKLYNKDWPIESLHQRTVDYLDTLISIEGGPLMELEKRKLLKNEVLETVLCTLMYSVASFELACDSSSFDKVKNPNLSITAFIQISSALDMIHDGLDIPQNVFFMSWLFYMEVLITNKVKLSAMHSLQSILISSGNFNAPLAKTTPEVTPRGEEFTDSAESLNPGLVNKFRCVLRIVTNTFFSMQIDEFRVISKRLFEDGSSDVHEI